MRLSRDLLNTAARFGLVGAATVGVYFIVLAALRPFIQHVAILSVAAYLASAVFNFVLQAKVTFGVGFFDTQMVGRYLTMHGLCMAINAGLMHVLVDGFGFFLYGSQLFVTGIVAVCSFTISRYWVYRPIP